MNSDHGIVPNLLRTRTLSTTKANVKKWIRKLRTSGREESILELIDVIFYTCGYRDLDIKSREIIAAFNEGSDFLYFFIIKNCEVLKPCAKTFVNSSRVTNIIFEEMRHCLFNDEYLMLHLFDILKISSRSPNHYLRKTSAQFATLFMSYMLREIRHLGKLPNHFALKRAQKVLKIFNNFYFHIYASLCKDNNQHIRTICLDHMLQWVQKFKDTVTQDYYFKEILPQLEVNHIIDCSIIIKILMSTIDKSIRIQHLYEDLNLTDLIFASDKKLAGEAFEAVVLFDRFHPHIFKKETKDKLFSLVYSDVECISRPAGKLLLQEIKINTESEEDMIEKLVGFFNETGKNVCSASSIIRALGSENFLTDWDQWLKVLYQMDDNDKKFRTICLMTSAIIHFSTNESCYSMSNQRRNRVLVTNFIKTYLEDLLEKFSTPKEIELLIPIASFIYALERWELKYVILKVIYPITEYRGVNVNIKIKIVCTSAVLLIRGHLHTNENISNTWSKYVQLLEDILVHTSTDIVKEYVKKENLHEYIEWTLRDLILALSSSRNLEVFTFLCNTCIFLMNENIKSELVLMVKANRKPRSTRQCYDMILFELSQMLNLNLSINLKEIGFKAICKVISTCSMKLAEKPFVEINSFGFKYNEEFRIFLNEFFDKTLDNFQLYGSCEEGQIYIQFFNMYSNLLINGHITVYYLPDLLYHCGKGDITDTIISRVFSYILSRQGNVSNTMEITLKMLEFIQDENKAYALGNCLANEVFKNTTIFGEIIKYLKNYMSQRSGVLSPGLYYFTSILTELWKDL